MALIYLQKVVIFYILYDLKRIWKKPQRIAPTTWRQATKNKKNAIFNA